MADSLSFHFTPGNTVLHRTDPRIKILGMILFSLLLLKISLYRLALTVLLLLFLKSGRKGRLSLVFIIMPMIIFSGNFLSLRPLAGTETALWTAGLRSGAFLCILRIAALFTATTDPMALTPAIYSVFRPVPLLPAARISTVMGLTLTLIPVILDEMAEIRDAMQSRCGWHSRRPVRNLFHMGLPLLDGVLVKAEALSDAMESRLYREDPTPPEDTAESGRLFSILFLFILAILYLIPGWIPFLRKESFFLFRFY